MKLSFVCNATSNDKSRLTLFLPAALSVFDSYIDEMIIIFETLPETGRIRELHGRYNMPMGEEDFLTFTHLDERIKFIPTDYTQLDHISRKYFGTPGINRCQSGTPVFAFLFGLEQAKNDHIIRSDCDMIFFNNGFIADALKKLPEYHFIIPPYFFMEKKSDRFFTSRSFFMNRPKVWNRLPLHPKKLDPVRSLHRKLSGKSPYLALEQMLEYNIERDPRLNVLHQPGDLGNTMHICTREEFSIPGIKEIIDAFITGNIPEEQFQSGVNFNQAFWKTPV